VPIHIHVGSASTASNVCHDEKLQATVKWDVS
jgi:hypothetical protein